MMKHNELNVLYEDNHIIVVIKPENVLSQEDITHEEDMLSIIKEYIKETKKKEGNVYLGLVHRLDRRVGGVMVFAKTSKAASRLSSDIRDHNFKKEYLAIVKGNVEKNGRLVNYLKKEDNKAIVCSEVEGKESILDYIVLKRFEKDNIDYTILKINLLTGRYNQIRSQLAYFGYPIVCDYKYGYKGENFNDVLGLFCYKISFNHPTKKEKITFDYLPNWGIWENLKGVDLSEK